MKFKTAITVRALFLFFTIPFKKFRNILKSNLSGIFSTYINYKFYFYLFAVRLEYIRTV